MAEERFLRLFRLMQLIPRAPKWIDTESIREVMQLEDTKATMRTLQRDLLDLERWLCLESNTDSKPYQWRFPAHAEMVFAPGLDPQTALALRLAELHLERVLPKATMKALQPHLQAAKKALDGKPTAKWLDKVRLVSRSQPLLPPAQDGAVVHVLQEALLSGLQVEVRYHAKGSDKVSDLPLHPLGLVHRDSVGYVVATAHHYTDVRLYPFHRIQDAKLLDAKANTPAGFSLDAYIDGGELGWRIGTNDIELVLLFDKEAALLVEETPLTHKQKLERREDGRVVVTATLPETHVLRAWILGFGANVEVLAPQSLREAIRDAHGKAAARYA